MIALMRLLFAEVQLDRYQNWSVKCIERELRVLKPEYKRTKFEFIYNNNPLRGNVVLWNPSWISVTEPTRRLRRRTGVTQTINLEQMWAAALPAPP